MTQTTMPIVRTPPAPHLLVALMLLASCKGATEVDPLGDPGGGGGGPTVATIAVTSPIDSVMAVGRTAQLSAAATDASGSPITVTFSWNSTNPSTATVSGTGVVSAIAAGTTLIQASSPNNVTGQLQMRAVDADLDVISTALTDSFVQAMRGALSGATASTLNAFLSDCSTHITSGNVLAIDACLQGAQDTNGATGTDDALLAVLALFLEYAQRQLQL